MSVEGQKLAADKLEDFNHPCGGSGCPDEWEQTMYDERPYTCGKKVGEADVIL